MLELLAYTQSLLNLPEAEVEIPRTYNFTFADLFCGIGGFHLALEALGGTCVKACDNNKLAREIYQKNHKVADHILESDICKMSREAVAGVDILTAGFPCQPFSLAGQKKGFTDANRGNLFFELLRIINHSRPKAIFLENVRHIIKHDNGETIAIIRRELRRIGYRIECFIVRASDFGLPQHRPRIFMIGFDERRGLNVHQFNEPHTLPLRYTMSDVFGAECNKKIGFTIRVGGRGSKITDKQNWDTYLVDGKLTQLGPKEGLKMMGFPDDFILPTSTTQAMKQLGNSIAVPAANAFGREILKVLDRKNLLEANQTSTVNEAESQSTSTVNNAYHKGLNEAGFAVAIPSI